MSKQVSKSPAVQVNVTTGRATVKAWYNDRAASVANVDQEHATAMFAVAHAVAIDGSGITGKSVAARAERIGANSNLASRLKVAYDVAVSVAKRHGSKPDATVFAAVLTVSFNASAADIRSASETISANTVSAVRARLSSLVTDTVAKRKPSGKRGDITDAAKVSKASDGTTGNAHGGSGDDSAVKNGDRGDVKPTLSTEIRRITRLVSEASESGEIDSSAWKALEALTTVIQTAKAKAKAVKVTPATVKVTASK